VEVFVNRAYTVRRDLSDDRTIFGHVNVLRLHRRPRHLYYMEPINTSNVNFFILRLLTCSISHGTSEGLQMTQPILRVFFN
jgi:hypothetical protein